MAYLTHFHLIPISSQHHVFFGACPQESLGGAFRREGEGVRQEDPQAEEPEHGHEQQLRPAATTGAHGFDQVSAAEECHTGMGSNGVLTAFVSELSHYFSSFYG